MYLFIWYRILCSYPAARRKVCTMSILNGNNAVLASLSKAAELIGDDIFTEKVNAGDVDGAVKRAEDIGADNDVSLSAKLVASLVPGQVSRMRTFAAELNEDLAVSRARHRP